MWLAAMALIIGADPTAADTFKQMEQAVWKAKNVQGKLNISAADGDKKLLDIQGRFVVAEGDKVRLDVTGDKGGMKGTILMVSDGKKMTMSVSRDGKGQEQDTIKKMTEIVKTTYTRSGLFIGIFSVRPKDDDEKAVFDADKDLPVKDFKFGKKEKLGDHEAQIVEYTCTPKGRGEALAITVWIDLKTHLILKRIVVVPEGKVMVTITETYSDTTLDGKLDDKDFVIGK